MAEFTTPAVVEVPTSANLTDLIVTNAVEDPDAVVFSRRLGGEWVDVTARAFLEEVTAVAKGLVASGVAVGDRVALMSCTRYEWTLLDFAIWSAGAITVPIFETSSAEQVEWILGDSGATAVVVETARHEATVEQARAGIPDVRQVWQIEAGAVDALVAAGAAVHDAEIDARRAALGSDSVATVIYTSGTTGRPKGCELTHGNFRWELDNAVGSMLQLFSAEGASTLLFLPLAHVLARIIQIGCVEARARMGHTSDLKNIVEDLGAFKPTFILSVPRVFEKVYNSAQQKAESEGKGRIFHAAADTAIAWSQALDTGGPGLRLRLRHAVFDRLVYRKLRAALGGQVQWAVSGGAPLGVRLGHFFRGIGVVVLEGYGLTETTAAMTVNRPDRLRIGTVGRPLPSVSVRIAEDGEILVKGPTVFRHYRNNPEATAAALSPEGWFHTGDLGRLDDDGFLTITGRKKEILVTAGGKNVAPAVLEDRLRAHPLVSQCIVVGDGQPFIAALVTLDTEALPAWLEHHGKPVRSVAELVDDPDVVASVQHAVDEANKAVSRAEAIRKFRILPVDFTEEGGQLTPTLKLKRDVVTKEFAAEIEALYS